METDKQPTSVLEETVSVDNEQSAPIEAASSETLTTPLPGVITLIKSGFGIYRERLGALVGVGALQLVAWFILAIPFVLTLLWGGVSIATTTIATLISVPIGIGIYFWSVLASMEIIRGHAQRISLQQVLSTTITKVLPFAWMILIVFLMLIGISAFFSLLFSLSSYLIIVALGLHSGSAIMGALLVMISFVSSVIIVGILFSIWFMFSYWVFVDEKKRDVNALVASRELVRKDVGAIFWRLFASTFLVSLIYPIISILNSSIFSGTAHDFVNFLLAISFALFLTPILLSIVYVLYSSVKIRVGSEAQENKKLYWYFVGCTIVGVVGIFLIMEPVSSLLTIFSGF